MPPAARPSTRAPASGARIGRSSSRRTQRAAASTIRPSGATVVLVPTARKKATSAGTSRRARGGGAGVGPPARAAPAAPRYTRGVKSFFATPETGAAKKDLTPAVAHSAASQASQARAGRSVFGPVSWRTTSGCTANAPSASAITHPGVRSARSPTTPAARREHQGQRREQRHRHHRAGDAGRPRDGHLVRERVGAEGQALRRRHHGAGVPAVHPQGDLGQVVDDAVEAQLGVVEHEGDVARRRRPPERRRSCATRGPGPSTSRRARRAGGAWAAARPRGQPPR